jgi:hypothetical protein
VTRVSRIAPLLAAALLLGACASVPSGPSVMVLPGTGKSFDQFRADELECRQYAHSQVGGTTPDQAIENSAVKSAAVGAAVGAVAGAVIGGHRGAATGAGTGLIVGSVAGAGAGQGSGRTAQQRYDIGFQQCMYAKGHRVPVAGRFESGRPAPAPAAAAPATPAPPPPGSPPPAPSRIVR